MDNCTCIKDLQMTCIVHPTDVSLKKHITSLKAELASVKAENARLRDALAKFATDETPEGWVAIEALNEATRIAQENGEYE